MHLRARLLHGERMTWVKLDDQFFRHTKSTAAGKDGRALFLAGLCYCASQLTDGHISKTALMLVAAEAGVKHTVAKTLVDVGLWDDDGHHGYWVHDFLEYNPSATEVRAVRAKRAAAGAIGGKQKASNRLANCQDFDYDMASNGVAKSYPVPGPVPRPKNEEQIIASPPVNLDRAIAFEAAMPNLRLAP